MHGICHVEIPSKNYEKSAKFYKAVFDWEIQMMPQMDYAMYKAPSGINGGFNKHLEINSKSGILLYLEVENIDAALEKIKKNGGKQTQGKTLISPEIGYFAMFNDSEGNNLGLWSQK